MARAVGEGFDCFLFGLVLLAFGGCSPQNLAAAKGEQAIPVHRILTAEDAEKMADGIGQGDTRDELGRGVSADNARPAMAVATISAGYGLDDDGVI